MPDLKIKYKTYTVIQSLKTSDCVEILTRFTSEISNNIFMYKPLSQSCQLSVKITLGGARAQHILISEILLIK